MVTANYKSVAAYEINKIIIAADNALEGELEELPNDACRERIDTFLEELRDALKILKAARGYI